MYLLLITTELTLPGVEIGTLLKMPMWYNKQLSLEKGRYGTLVFKHLPIQGEIEIILDSTVLTHLRFAQ